MRGCDNHTKIESRTCRKFVEAKMSSTYVEKGTLLYRYWKAKVINSFETQSS